MKITKSTKIIRKTWVFAVCIILWMTAFSFADIMPENSHSVERCVKISENLDFQDQNITLKAKITWPMIDSWEKIENLAYDTCLSKGYKFNQLSVLLEKDWEIQDLWILETWGGYVNDSNTLTAEEFGYKVIYEDGKYVLQKFREIKNYNGMIKEVLFRNNIPHKNISLSDVYYYDFGIALLMTILIESLVLLGMIKVFFRKNNISKLSVSKIIFAGIFCSFATLPYLRFIGNILFTSIEISYLISTLLWELVIVIIEAVMLKYILELSRKKALLLSFLANAVSFWLGLL